MSANGPKDVCLISGDGYFIDAVRVFYDVRAGDYIMPPSAVDAPYPDITKVDNGYLARWDAAAQKWRYEIEDYSFGTVDADPLEILKASIDRKMDVAKDKIIEAFVDGDTVKQQAWADYRNNLRMLLFKMFDSQKAQAEAVDYDAAKPYLAGNIVKYNNKFYTMDISATVAIQRPAPPDAPWIEVSLGAPQPTIKENPNPFLARKDPGELIHFTGWPPFPNA